MKTFIKKHEGLYIFFRFFKNILSFLFGVLIAVVSSVEVSIFLITHPRIFKNEIIYVFYHWSFGHTISGLDYASRLYYPHRISVIYIPHPGSNAYLPLCFEHNMDTFIYRSIIPFGGVFGGPRYRAVCFVLSVITGLTKRFQVIERSNFYKILSLADDKLLLGDEETGKLEKAVDWTGYLRLLRENIGRAPRLPDELTAICRNKIIKAHPFFFDKPFVTLLLREKGRDYILNTAFRCCGPQENYAKTVEFLAQNGYNVVGTGETRHKCFEGISGYYSLKGVDIDPKLLNLFLLMNCRLFIGQQSGVFVLPDSCGILSLICDAMPYRLGTFCRDDIILFKHLREKNTGRRLSLVEVFKQHQDLAYGMNFDRKKIVIEPNSPEEILEAAKECHAILQGKLKLSEEDERLAAAFRSLPSQHMHLHYHGNRTSLHMLRQLRNELLFL